MRLSRQWDRDFEQMGNQPGLNVGEVVIELGRDVAGMSSVQLDSSKLTVAAEGGQVIGVFLVLDDSHRLFVPWSNVTAIYDAPAKASKRKA